jgi:L-seryl-tRNA(Ser) seleniumtransferase
MVSEGAPAEPDAASVAALGALVLDGMSMSAEGGSALESSRVPEMVGHALRRRLHALFTPRPRRVINATGVILHTNLGRAPVSHATALAMQRAASGYSDLEYDLETGRRGSRHDLLEPLLRELTGAEAALVVNNNAGATVLVLSALASGREVIASRGELVEIGGGFRIPEVMAAGGARLREVGTTNRTRIADYRDAVGDETALLLRVHTSNYRIQGFTEAPSLASLVELSRESGVPLLDDLGSGSFIDTARFGLAPEPLAPLSIQAGADLVCFSGDKLLGGPQAGIIVGRADLIKRLRKHPLTRAMRPDKATLAGLQATLAHYARGEAEEKIPLWRMMAAEKEALRERAEAWREALSADPARPGFRLEIVEDRSAVGGGSLPGETLPTMVLAIETAHPDRLAAQLRLVRPALVGRIADGCLLLDPRTVLPGEDQELVAALRDAMTTNA